MTERPEDAPEDSQAGGPNPAEPTDADPTADATDDADADGAADSTEPPPADDDAPGEPDADEMDLAADAEPTAEEPPTAPAATVAARDTGRGGRASRRVAAAHAPAAPTPSELAVHVGDRISAVFVLLAVGTFVAILLYGIVLGSGGLLTPVPTPTPRSSVTTSPSASVSPSSSASAAPSSPAASTSPSAAPSVSASAAPSASPSAPSASP